MVCLCGVRNGATSFHRSGACYIALPYSRSDNFLQLLDSHDASAVVKTTQALDDRANVIQPENAASPNPSGDVSAQADTVAKVANGIKATGAAYFQVICLLLKLLLNDPVPLPRAHN